LPSILTFTVTGAPTALDTRSSEAITVTTSVAPVVRISPPFLA
jgi:hypothetical protein